MLHGTSSRHVAHVMEREKPPQSRSGCTPYAGKACLPSPYWSGQLEEKSCKTCKRGQPLSAFHKRLADTQVRCKACAKAANKAYYIAHKMEHMQPISRGGAHTINNVVPACRRCNSSKGKKTLLEFIGQATNQAVVVASGISDLPQQVSIATGV